MAKSFYTPHQISHCIVLLSAVVPPFVFTEVNIHVIYVSRRVSQFGHFDAETFAFFRDILLENYPSLEFHNDFIYCQIFGRVVKF